MACPPESFAAPLGPAIRWLELRRPLGRVPPVNPRLGHHLLQKMETSRLSAGDGNRVLVVLQRGAE